MKALNAKISLICILLSPLLFFTNASAQAPAEAFLKRFEGTWQGDGRAFGMAARLHLKWEWVLGDKFLRLSLRNEMRTANGQTQVFEGHAYYRPVGPPNGFKYEARWFDSRGTWFPIQAHSEGESLIALWGAPEQEQGKSLYRLVDPGKLEVIDAVLQKDGSWKEFGRFVVQRAQL
ncbi:MAG: hypothetical protein ABR568_09700 [Pyrinomonadaceae bacterium]